MDWSIFVAPVVDLIKSIFGKNDKQSKIKIRGGKNSSNINVSGNYRSETTNYTIGPSLSEVREIAIDVFKANAITLAKEAETIMFERANIFIEDFLKEAKQEHLNKFNQPDIQRRFYIAQHSYTNSGDIHLKDILIKALLDRTGTKPRDYNQILLDEAISTIPKLTNAQLDYIAVCAVLQEPETTFFNSAIEVRKYLVKNFKPLVQNLNELLDDGYTRELRAHLMYTGCIQSTQNFGELPSHLYQHFHLLFGDGNTIDEFKFPDTKMEKLLVRHFVNSDKFQLGVQNAPALLSSLKKMGFDQNFFSQYYQILPKHNFGDEKEILEYIKNVFPEMIDILNKIPRMTVYQLSPVGVIIGKFQIKAKSLYSEDELEKII